MIAPTLSTVLSKLSEREIGAMCEYHSSNIRHRWADDSINEKLANAMVESLKRHNRFKREVCEYSDMIRYQFLTVLEETTEKMMTNFWKIFDDAWGFVCLENPDYSPEETIEEVAQEICTTTYVNMFKSITEAGFYKIQSCGEDLCENFIEAVDIGLELQKSIIKKVGLMIQSFLEKENIKLN